MTLRMVLEANDKEFAQRLRDFQKPMARAMTAAMKDVAAVAKAGWQEAISAGGMGSRFRSGVSAKVFPSRGDSLSPVAWIKHHIPYASVFETGATIVPSHSGFLWLPLPNVPVISGGRRLPASKFFDVVGTPLYTINRPGKPPLLGANVRMTDARSSKAISLSLLKRGRNPGGKGTVRLVPLYVGVPTVTDPKKFEVFAAGQRAQGLLGVFYANHLEAGK